MPEILCRSTSHEEEEDRISNLHDELLISILSQLSAQGDIDQAARTSILSSRWRNLWRFSLTNLRFVCKVPRVLLDVFCGGDICGFLYKSMYNKFVGWVNRVLDLHLRNSIDDFHLLFSLADLTRYSPNIDGWLNFVCVRVKRLSVDLPSNYSRTIFNSVNPKVIIKGCQGVDTTLVSLRLKHVHVTGESVEYLLSVFRSLDDLSVSLSYALEELTVSGLSLKLKHLEIVGCDLKRLHIHHVNTLASFKYNGLPGPCVTIQETPHLVNLSIGYEKDETVKILTQIPRMETLQLSFKASRMLERATDFP